MQQIQIDEDFLKENFKEDRKLDIELKRQMLEAKKFDLQKQKEEHAVNKINNLRWLLESRRLDEAENQPAMGDQKWVNTLDVVDEGLVTGKIMQIIKTL